MDNYEDIEVINCVVEEEDIVKKNDMFAELIINHPVLIPLPSLFVGVEEVTETLTECDIGGKIFYLTNEEIKCTGIDKVWKKTDTSYFIDRDGQYFDEILKIVTTNKLTDDVIREIDSDNILNEMVNYGIISNDHKPLPKLILGRKTIDDEEIVTIRCQQTIFKTYKKNLTYSNELFKSGVFAINADPKIFRYIINMFRNEELFTVNNQILKLLDSFGVNYKKPVTNVLPVVINLQPKDDDSIKTYLSESISFHAKSDNVEGNHSSFFFKNNRENPRHINYHTNVSLNNGEPMQWGKVHRFYLSNEMTDLINEINIIIDIPVLKPKDNAHYIDNLLAHIINEVTLVGTNISNAEEFVISKFNGISLHFYNQVEKEIFLYNEPCNISVKDSSVEIHRCFVTIPFTPLKNHIPLKRIGQTKHRICVDVGIADFNKIIQVHDESKPVTKYKLLNLKLMTNDVIIHSKNDLVVTEPNLNFFQEYVTLISPFNIEKIHNKTYHQTSIVFHQIVCLSEFYFFIVHEKDLFTPLSRKMIEAEITINDKKIILGDSFIFSKYTRKHYLDKPPIDNMYYYSFVSNPLDNPCMGGVSGEQIKLTVKSLTDSENMMLVVFAKSMKKIFI